MCNFGFKRSMDSVGDKSAFIAVAMDSLSLRSLSRSDTFVTILFSFLSFSVNRAFSTEEITSANLMSSMVL